MKRICNLCDIKKDDRTVCNSCYNRNRRKNNKINFLTQNQETKIDNNNKNDNNPSVSAYENHRHIAIGPSNVGKTFTC